MTLDVLDMAHEMYQPCSRNPARSVFSSYHILLGFKHPSTTPLCHSLTRLNDWDVVDFQCLPSPSPWVNKLCYWHFACNQVVHTHYAVIRRMSVASCIYSAHFDLTPLIWFSRGIHPFCSKMKAVALVPGSVIWFFYSIMYTSKIKYSAKYFYENLLQRKNPRIYATKIKYSAKYF
jgi:hypothetical protein